MLAEKEGIINTLTDEKSSLSDQINSLKEDKKILNNRIEELELDIKNREEIEKKRIEEEKIFSKI